VIRATVVIATADRPESLRATLLGWRAGDALPVEVRVVDASDDDATRRVCADDWTPLRVRHLPSTSRSAARQRNAGAAECATEILVFSDDDVEIPPCTLARLLEVFERDGEERVGGVAGTIEGLHHVAPSRASRCFYRLQAGYQHPHFGGRFFGAAINTLPTDAPDDPELYPSEWLNSTLVAYRTRLFARERFPAFDGYSFQEDVNVSVRIGRTHELYFHRGIRYLHKSLPGRHKADPRRLAEMRLVNRWYNAAELLNARGLAIRWKFLLTLLFETAVLLRHRPSGWVAESLGGWGAWMRLALLGRNPRGALGAEGR
jgi:glycosyltransferase involved in cell wall biosynthesis